MTGRQLRRSPRLAKKAKDDTAIGGSSQAICSTSLRRSPRLRHPNRLAAKAVADDPAASNDNVEESENGAYEGSGRALKSAPGEEEARDSDNVAEKAVTKASKRRARKSRSKKATSSSLQSLGDDNATRREKRASEGALASASLARKCSSHVYKTPVKSRGVKFDLGQNSFAEYEKENPPSAVKHLPREVDLTSTLVADDETRRNEEILAEWDDSFDEYSDSDEQRGRRTRRTTMLGRRLSMSP
ncbi:hypothetical protein ACHAWF_018751 [Thalassiosira exigua]